MYNLVSVTPLQHWQNLNEANGCCLPLQGATKDLERAVEAYRRAEDKQSSQALFNLGYMHERGLGLPLDLHLAKRYYDGALQEEPAAFVPVTLALTSLWLRQHYTGSFLVLLSILLLEVPV